MGFSFVYKKEIRILCCLYHCCLFVLDMGFGGWCMKEEIDNSSEALQLYRCIDNGVSCQLYSS